jgi:GAF domain-containing protein
VDGGTTHQREERGVGRSTIKQLARRQRARKSSEADRRDVLDNLDRIQQAYMPTIAYRPTEPELDALAQSAAQLSGADRAVMTRVVDGSIEFVGQYERTPDGRIMSEAQEALGCCRRIISRNTPLELLRMPADLEMWQSPLSMLGVPIRAVDDEVLGALCVVARENRSWSESDQEDITALAGRAASEMTVLFA